MHVLPIRFNTQMQVHVGRPTSIALPPAAQPAQPTNNNNATQGAGTVILGATQGEELRLLCSQVSRHAYMHAALACAVIMWPPSGAGRAV